MFARLQRSHVHPLTAFFAVLGLSVFLAQPLAAAPGADLWPRWQTHDAAATGQIDHAAWDALLTRYARPAPDGVTRFGYGSVSGADKSRLDGYVSRLAATPISTYNRAEQLAYWVNLYNALTVKTILDHFPVKSIRDVDISPGWFADGPWGAKQITVEGEKISLDDIEHRILRPIWKDPRIHYVVNCASIGCPNLPRVAMTAANAETLLQQGAVDYVNHARGASVKDGDLVVSSIYSWFQADFGDSEAGVIAHLRKFAKPGLARQLDGRDGYSGHEYDWTLNGS